MSRRASLFSKQNPGKPRVRFPDELVFEDNIKENDLPALHSMLRRASLQMDINGINGAGLTPLHQAVLDGNLAAVTILVEHGADVNRLDEDTWSPLHAACAEGHADVAEYLLQKGADKTLKNEDGERPIDLVDPSDFATVRVMLQGQAGSGQCDDDDDDDDIDDTADSGGLQT